MGFPFRNIIIALGAAAGFGCSLIDDDLSDCGVTFETSYEMRLVTNMDTEIRTQLPLESDIYAATALKDYLKNIFTDYAHDIDLSFYCVEADSIRLKHMSELMDASQSKYVLYIPSRRYMHLAAANLRENGIVKMTDSTLCHRSTLVQKDMDTIPAHRTGLFTAKLPMDVLSGQDQSFDVRLYMSNCAASLVIDTLGCNLKHFDAFASGFATSFAICDSIYGFKSSPVVRADLVPVGDGRQICYTSVNFPSKEPEGTKTAGDEASWKWKVYSTLSDGTVVETELGVENPLRAGQLRIIKVKALDNGAVQPDMSQVGISVKIDWNYAHEVDIEL